VDVDLGQLVGRRLNRIVFVMYVDELLARKVFATLLEAKELIARWRKTYNTVRPHSSLGYRPPAPAACRPCRLGWETRRASQKTTASW
jgi:transposase InsO family protein